jgi:lipid-binding SYLF domain-containing protein
LRLAGPPGSSYHLVLGRRGWIRLEAGMKPMRGVLALAAICGLAVVAGAREQSDEAARIREATTVLQEIRNAPDTAVPDWVVEKAQGIAVFPSVKKGGLLVGGQWGRGIMSAKSVKSGTWSAPAFLTLTGGTIGAQIGGEAVDLVLVVIDQRGLEQLARNQFKIGADAGVSAGPVGRSAEASTDAQMRAKILSYSRSRGLFAGITLNGSTIKQDRDANERFYGQPYKTSQILFDRLGGAPDPVPAWRAELQRK